VTLTQTAVITKRAIIIIVVSFFLLVFGKIGWEIYYRYTLSQLPPPTQSAEQKFGSIPAIIFPTSKSNSANFSYSVDTTTGELPNFPKLIKVYFIPQAGLSLLAPDRAKSLAQKLNFLNGPDNPTPEVYRFTDQNSGELIIDTPTGNFYYNLSLADATPSGNLNLVKKDKIIEDFKKFLADKISLPDSISSGRGEIMISDNPKTGVISLIPADFDNLPIITASYNQGLIRADITLTESDMPLKYIKVNYTFWPIDPTTFSTYPLKTSTQALSDLKTSRAYVSLSSTNFHISITSVKLAYFETEYYTPYLQPVFVFEGPGFVALVPAISTQN